MAVQAKQIESESTRAREGRLRRLQTPYLWAFTTYFAEGFPYSLIRTVSSVFFRDMRVSLEAIGLTSLFGLPWVLKFLWGPQIDQFGTKRRWMLAMQAILVMLILAVAFLSPLSGTLKIIAVILFVGAFVAATHDMAIDGYYLEALDQQGQARFVGYRVMAYRIAMMTGTGVVVTLGALYGWLLAFLSGGIVLAALFLYHLLLLPGVEQERKPFSALFDLLLQRRSLLIIAVLVVAASLLSWAGSLGFFSKAAAVPVLGRISLSGWIGIGLLAGLLLLGLLRNRLKSILIQEKDSFYARAFMTYMDRERMGMMLSFIILMRAGDAMLSSMVSPFLVDLGIKVHYGWISAGVGLPLSIAGAMIGGWLISRYGLGRTLWPFLLAQNLTNLVYMILALYLAPFVHMNTGAAIPQPIGSLNLLLAASVHGFDQFAGGLGTSVLVTFIMRTCLTEFKAAHFAIGTGLMNISGVFSGVLSGFLAEWAGYGYFFGISFLLSLPGMVLAFSVPLGEDAESSPGSAKRIAQH
jgi:PAT family beta-lactamase induction signal transducer AmpG